MILSIVLSCIILTKAHELVAPESDRLTHYEVVHMQLMFSRSHGIVRALPDKSFRVTDVHSSDYHPHFLRMGSTNRWVGKLGGKNEVTIDMTSSFLVTGVATKGFGNQFVKRYTVKTSQNGFVWRSQGLFLGNFDGETVCKVQFDRPVRARFVKLTVMKYQHHPSLRMDVLIYDMDGNNKMMSELPSV